MTAPSPAPAPPTADLSPLAHAWMDRTREPGEGDVGLCGFTWTHGDVELTQPGDVLCVVCVDLWEGQR